MTECTAQPSSNKWAATCERQRVAQSSLSQGIQWSSHSPQLELGNAPGAQYPWHTPRMLITKMQHVGQLAAHCPQTLQDLCRKVALRTGEVWKGPQGCGAFRSGSSACCCC
eukprot:418601-Pelagomonas_calceolata.AAC.9